MKCSDCKREIKKDYGCVCGGGDGIRSFTEPYHHPMCLPCRIAHTTLMILIYGSMVAFLGIVIMLAIVYGIA